MRQWLKDKRLAKGMTQAQVAEAAGIDERTYRNVEHGLQTPYLRTCMGISAALDFHVREWMSNE